MLAYCIPACALVDSVAHSMNLKTAFVQYLVALLMEASCKEMFYTLLLEMQC